MQELSVTLLMSVAAGLGQLGLGILFLARKSLRQHSQRAVRAGNVWLALWLTASGLTEVVVTGLDVWRNLTGQPDLRDALAWKSRADAFLFWASLAIVAGFIVSLAGQRIFWRQKDTR